MNVEQFLSMGGYAFYVWTSYVLVIAMLLFNLALPWRRKSEIQNSIRRMLRQARGRS